jgi:hypothetical protein
LVVPLTTHFWFSHPFLHCCFSAADVIYDNVDVDANIIFGALVDDKITNGEVSINYKFPLFYAHERRTVRQ